MLLTIVLSPWGLSLCRKDSLRLLKFCFLKPGGNLWFFLDEVELSVEMNAQGQVSILGNGGSLSNRGAIKLKFKRSHP
ncbi:Pepco domain-containing protein [Egbenema bharatensis]|uniref:Pepco domain-containing protein n=1 Tax=Egbenema bharatensis TaxID=3463334 RepID=UPI003A86EC14